MYCGKCGKNNNPSNGFCDGCGAPLKAKSSPFVPGSQPSNQDIKAAGSASSGKTNRGYLWIYIAIVALCLFGFGIKSIVENNKQLTLNEVHAMLLKDWDTKVDPYDSYTQGILLDFTTDEMSIKLYHNYQGQRKYNRYSDVVTYKYEVISPTCIKAWYKSDSPHYFDISFNDDYTVMYFEYNGVTRVMYPHHDD